MIRTVIFDFDGTIADTLPKIFELYNKYANEFNLPVLNRKEAEELRNKSAFEIIKSFGISIIKIPAIANRVLSELKKSITQIKIFKGMDEVLNSIKARGFQLGLLTSNSQENVDKYLDYHKLDFFDFVHSEKNIFGKSKTLGKLISQYNLEKTKTIYVGDEVRDIEACRDNGIKIISVTWGFNIKEILQKNKPDYLVDKPGDILKII
ncbi:hypothetical protein A2954_04395 [Candidatus Roizmanbacteria bacterium RIFCSPLOWO2_01_FULL_37_12]|uniref:Carotenoid oxygenase n=1 Tax=Candidatus Roizmanbacteria bacterium RIFCSPLOWO2_01_FULL_37_12 TaxID=1802056 RepID=A0A1F7IFT9_9BACT|nr:MAG: hypothetical protein A3D76_06305 [Candidatus Roizmanbacteria bacterium RIFCSPHIGHO2_02_FULL_37_9b]OGK42223.1 MAG: hypothetical protein A2954_04395 [Candidatus Roizmanbacteria bacterium RIFCSPLOWO2_01_FULL_37_12]